MQGPIIGRPEDQSARGYPASREQRGGFQGAPEKANRAGGFEGAEVRAEVAWSSEDVTGLSGIVATNSLKEDCESTIMKLWTDVETAMIQQLINWLCNFIDINPTTVQMIGGILSGAAATLAAYLVFAAAVAACGLLVSVYLRTTI